MKYIPQIKPEVIEAAIKAAQNFPPNIAANIPPDVQKKILIFLCQKYFWPQIQERMWFEPAWKKLLEMARIDIPYDETFSNTRHAASKAKNEADQSNRTNNRVSDSVVHDTIEKLTDITYFIAFKDGLPCQFALPDYITQPMANDVYQPLANTIKAGNCLLQWTAGNCSLRNRSLITFRHHFSYGVAFVIADWAFRMQMKTVRNNDGSMQQMPEIAECGTTFDPISLRKLWLNWRLPLNNLDAQPCPFFFDEINRAFILENVYDPKMNPFGYVNLDQTLQEQYIYTSSEMQSVRDALSETLEQMYEGQMPSAPGIAQILDPKHSVEARWTAFPMLPFDPRTMEFETRADGKTKVPYKRFVMELFGPQITSGQLNILRMQENYYPKNKLPILASVHMPDLDSGAYCPSIGQFLYNHYKEICLCMEQFLDNKDWINDAPAWVQSSSPAVNTNLNEKGAKIVVNGPNDFGWKPPYDATGSTVAMLQLLRQQAQVTGKATEAVLGQAMGQRTSATEANNAYQAGMSSITTDIDALSDSLHGAWAERVWDYCALWMPTTLLSDVTGQFGFALDPQKMRLGVGVETNVGSTYVEKVVKQQNIRYLLESSLQDPSINRAPLWKQLLEVMQLDPSEIVNDGGREQQIQFATLQTCETYLGKFVMVDPDQDHQIAIKVKTSFLKDQSSYWNQDPQYAVNIPKIIQQIQQHQMFLRMQMQMQLAQMQMQAEQARLGVHNDNPPQLKPAPASGTNQVPTSPGQIAQQNG